MKRRLLHTIKGRAHKVKHLLSSSQDVGFGVPLLPAQYAIDSPLQGRLDEPTVVVEGWIIPNDGVTVQGLRTHQGTTYTNVPRGLKRADVARAFPDKPGALESGFSLEVAAIDGLFELQVDFGKGYTTMYTLELQLAPEKLVADYYNPQLAERMAEHKNLLANKKTFFYEPARDAAYKPVAGDPRLVALYLPQFHPIPENDQVWGKGFTEWTNVTTAEPRFVGHQQPILPRDLGFYDLRLETTLSDQINLAKQHGIYGFCFYYYWFSGQRLLEQPLDSFLAHQEWDFNFAICWANENWTKRWDGRDNEVIVAQQYSEDDPLKFIKDVEPILLDPRYIQEDEKPLLVVFRASELKDPARYAKVWRDYFREKHNTELYLVSCLSFEDVDPREYGFDAGLDFAPQSIFFKNKVFKKGKYPFRDFSDKLLDPNFKGMVADYRTIALNQDKNDFFNFPLHGGVTPAWDNDARKKGKGFVMQYNNPDLYATWLDNVLATETKKTGSPLVFLNAWNEWAEGAVLEPTIHYGNAILNRTTEVLSRYSGKEQNRIQFPLYGITRQSKTELAVVVHLYYPEKWPYLYKKFAALATTPYDLFVTINEKDQSVVEEIKRFKPDAYVYVVPNRGRDVLPFLHIAQRLQIHGYKYVLKLHAKKSKHRSDGTEWFEEVVSNLLPDTQKVQETIALLGSGRTQLVGPFDHLVSLKRHMGSNETTLGRLLSDIAGEEIAQKVLAHPEGYSFFGGTMFWASLAGMNGLLDLCLMADDFESEQGQIDGTLAHAIERLFGILAHLHNGDMYQVASTGLSIAKLGDPEQQYKHAP